MLRFPEKNLICTACILGYNCWHSRFSIDNQIRELSKRQNKGEEIECVLSTSPTSYEMKVSYTTKRTTKEIMEKLSGVMIPLCKLNVYSVSALYKEINFSLTAELYSISSSLKYSDTYQNFMLRTLSKRGLNDETVFWKVFQLGTYRKITYYVIAFEREITDILKAKLSQLRSTKSGDRKDIVVMFPIIHDKTKFVEIIKRHAAKKRKQKKILDHCHIGFALKKYID